MRGQFPAFVDLRLELGWPFETLESAHDWAVKAAATDGRKRRIKLRRTHPGYPHRRWIVQVNR